MADISRIEGAAGLWRVTSRIFPSNAYLVAAENGSDCLLIDPGLDGDLIEEALALSGLTPTAILCTHGHFDHLGSAARFQQSRGAPVYLLEADVKTAGSSNFLLMALKMAPRITVPKIDRPVRASLSTTVSGRRVTFLASPGHTPGSAVIRVDGFAFTGDTMYSRGVGLSRLPGENVDQLKSSIENLFLTLPEDVLVLPGHGGEARLGEIRRTNLPLRSFLGLPSEPDLPG